jgi:quercetin dioxygenase-like cupin family protein
MSGSSHLSGKITKLSLPVFDGPPGPDAPLLKRILLRQGELAQVHDDDRPIHYLALIELREGTERGNHYHDSKEEFIYLEQGELLLLVEDIRTKARESLSMKAGDLVFIATGVAHTLRVTKPGRAIEFSTVRFNPADTFRYVIDGNALTEGQVLV